MAWFRIQLSEDERRVVNEERINHPSLQVRGKMLTIWLLHCGVTREKTAEIVGVSRATVQRYVEAYRTGGLEGLRQSNVHKAVSEMAAFAEIIRASFEAVVSPKNRSIVARRIPLSPPTWPEPTK